MALTVTSKSKSASVFGIVRCLPCWPAKGRVRMLVGTQGRLGWRSDHRPSSDLITQITVGLRLPWRHQQSHKNSNLNDDAANHQQPTLSNIRWQVSIGSRSGSDFRASPSLTPTRTMSPPFRSTVPALLHSYSPRPDNGPAASKTFVLGN